MIGQKITDQRSEIKALYQVKNQAVRADNDQSANIEKMG